jgi:hypothetical protein
MLAAGLVVLVFTLAILVPVLLVVRIMPPRA